MDIEALLEEEILDEFQSLRQMEKGTDAYTKTIDGILKLASKSTEIQKSYIENDLKLKQMDEDKKDRLIKNCISIAGIVIPTLVTIWGTVKSIEFERTGSFTTIMGRGYINKLLPKK